MIDRIEILCLVMPNANKSPEEVSSKHRIESLDQFRGYTVLGMLVVNFLGGYTCCPRILKHTNDYCSYADTIMPQFFFAVGMALHLVRNKGTTLQVQLRIVRRCIFLFLIGFAIYFHWFDNELRQHLFQSDFWAQVFKRDVCQTLVHIAITTIVVLPVLKATNLVRILWALALGLVHLVLSERFYFHWVHAKPSGIDGGPLGFMTWSIPVIAGMVTASGFPSAAKLKPVDETAPSLPILKWICASVLLMLIGYALSCGTRWYDGQVERWSENDKLAMAPVLPVVEAKVRWQVGPLLLTEPPGIPPPPATERAWNYWMMSQRAGTLSYQIFGSGWSLLVFVFFVSVCNMGGYHSRFLRSLGTNALACYIVHGFIIQWIGSFLKKDSSTYLVLIGLAVCIALVYAIAYTMERRRLFLRV